MKKLPILLILCLASFYSNSQNTENLSFSGAGDLTVSLGRYQIGTSVDILFRALGNYSEVGGRYEITGGWGQLPTVLYRGESTQQRLKFYGQVDPAASSFLFLYATWENQSPSKASSNTLSFTLKSHGSIEPGNTGNFANATLLPSLLTISALVNAIGINTTTPESLFHVNGNSKYRGYGWFSSKNNGEDEAALQLGQNKNYDFPVVEIKTNDNGGTSNSRWIGTRWAFHHSFQRSSETGMKNIVKLGGDEGDQYLSVIDIDGSTEKVRLSSNGNSFIQGKLGIGTTNTSEGYKLFVEDGIRTRKIKVDQVTWSDYVFNDDYKLPTLKEVEQFIQKNQHLPDVPSASEVEKNGLDLGNNQAVLLKKIEELTLYIIQQQKEIEELKKITGMIMSTKK